MVGQGSPPFAQSRSEGCVPTGHTHTVIKGEGGMTFTVHSRTQPVGWTVASSPQALGCNIVSLGTTHWPTQTLLQVQGLEPHEEGLPGGRRGWARQLSPTPSCSFPPAPSPPPTSRSNWVGKGRSNPPSLFSRPWPSVQPEDITINWFLPVDPSLMFYPLGEPSKPGRCPLPRLPSRPLPEVLF